MGQLIALFIILFTEIIPLANGKVLSQAEITKKSNGILARDNAILLGGPNVNHDTTVRQNKSFQFKNFIRNAPEAARRNTRNNAVLGLRNVINNAQLRGIFANDLEDSYDFLLKRLLRSEIVHQNTPPFIVGAPINHLNDMVVIVTDGVVSATGMLVPTPTVGGGAGARPITWKVLTCAHSLPGRRLGDDNAFHMMVNLPILGMSNLESLRVFKQAGRDATVDNGAGPLPANTIVFPDVRSFPRYDEEGDIGWCELANIDFLHNFLSFALNVPIMAGGAGFPVMAANTLTFNRNIPGAVAPVTYTLHFVNLLADATNLVNAINAVPKNQNFIIGFPGFGGGGLTVSQARNVGTQIYPSFIDPAGVGAGHNLFKFFHDAPSYWGMSGGPIFHVGLNTVDVFGIVKGASTGFAGQLASRCQGTFIRYF